MDANAWDNMEQEVEDLQYDLELASAAAPDSAVERYITAITTKSSNMGKGGQPRKANPGEFYHLPPLWYHRDCTDLWSVPLSCAPGASPPWPLYSPSSDSQVLFLGQGPTTSGGPSHRGSPTRLWPCVHDRRIGRPWSGCSTRSYLQCPSAI